MIAHFLPQEEGWGRAVIAHSCLSWTLPFLSSPLLCCLVLLPFIYLSCIFLSSRPILYVLFICKILFGMAKVEVDTHPWSLSGHVLHLASLASFACLCGFVFVRTCMLVSKCVYVWGRNGLSRGQ